ncbi:glycosyltransferase family 87 protein [Streptomyces sp. NRRL S-350]|uniref:glycosyltransferase family 87 protein n=1 Tax=Streptomyces sp. NRRL S-350 TaxID=1463902 RepID=UPI00068BC389|nr:glycosyltransferase family 87 protein [Streptomyces sp. NRRL S-350]
MPTRALLALAALVGALVLTVTGGGTLAHRAPLYAWYTVDAVLFALALAALRRVPRRQVAPLVLAGSVAVAAVGLLAPPRTSDDAYRYVWDGRVQAAGISPYAHTPDDPALVGLRDPGLWPVGGACEGWDVRRTAAGDCTRINRPAVHTIYPPVAQAWFLVVHPFGGGVRGVQAAGALLAVATTGALLVVGRGSRRAALWGWCPGVTVWSANDAHVDTLGALLLVVALGCLARRRLTAAGLLLGAAVAVKLIPGLALPGALPRRPARERLVLLGSALGASALAYLPYLAASGTGVLGYLPGYLKEEGYEQGRLDRFGLLALVLPDGLLPWAAGAVLAAVCLWVLRRGSPDRPWDGALLVTGTALLVVEPAYPWYGLLVVALVALDGRWEWLAVPAAGQYLYLTGGMGAQQLGYGVASVCVVAGAALRGRAGRRTRAAAAMPPSGSPSGPAAGPASGPRPADRAVGGDPAEARQR